MKFEKMLHDEIESEFECLQDIEFGSEEYQTGIDGVGKRIDKAIELKRVEADCENKSKDLELRTQQAKDENIKEWLKDGISIAGIVVPTLVTIWGTIKTFKFEEEGSITTNIGRGFINKLLPKK